MKHLLLASTLFACSGLTNAQTVSLQPQVGFDQLHSAIQVNNLQNATFNNLAPYAGLRLNVASKKGHGVFAAVSTNRSGAEYSFSDPETAATNYSVQSGGFRMNLVGGYQFNSKKIALGKPAAKSSVAQERGHHYYRSMSSRCGAYTSRCGASRMEKAQPKAAKWYMSVQPSVGAAFAPSNKAAVQTTLPDGKSRYTYTAANWTTAVVSGIAFEFGRNNTPEFTVGINYLHGLGNFGTESIQSTDQLKNSIANFQSNASAWNVNIGLPLSLLKKKEPVKEKSPAKDYYKSKCQRYRTI